MTKLFYNLARLALPILLITLTGCDKLVAPEISQEQEGSLVLYESSFESEESLNEWTIQPTIYTDEAAPNGGNQCVYVSGGCVFPHTSLDLGEVEVTGDYIIEVWGKLLYFSGGISLHRRSLDEEYGVESTSVTIDSEDWQMFTSEPINLHRGEYASLTMSSGGIIAGAMLIDRLKVYKID